MASSDLNIYSELWSLYWASISIFMASSDLYMYSDLYSELYTELWSLWRAEHARRGPTSFQTFFFVSTTKILFGIVGQARRTKRKRKRKREAGSHNRGRNLATELWYLTNTCNFTSSLVLSLALEGWLRRAHTLSLVIYSLSRTRMITLSRTHTHTHTHTLSLSGRNTSSSNYNSSSSTISPFYDLWSL